MGFNQQSTLFHSWPIYDKTYQNKALADAQAAEDEVLVGRFILITYCDEELPYATKKTLNSGGNVSGNANATQYKNNFNEDKRAGYKTPKDRMICQKRYNGSSMFYQEICFLNQADIDEITVNLSDVTKSLTDFLTTTKPSSPSIDTLPEIQEWIFSTDLHTLEQDGSIASLIENLTALQARVDVFLSGSEAQEALDTLAELQNWILTHGSEAQALLADVNKLGRVTFIETSDSNTVANDIVLLREHCPTPQRGHIGIIKRAKETHDIYNTYVYHLDEQAAVEQWRPTQGAYETNNVYFPDNLIITHPFGKYTPDATTGFFEIPCAGKSIAELFNNALQEAKEPAITNPSLSVSLKTASGNALNKTYEVGTPLNLKYKLTLNPGSYEFDNSTGVIRDTSDENWWTFKLINQATGIEKYSVSATGSSHEPEGTFSLTVEENSDYRVEATMAHTAGNTPSTNLGNLSTTTAGIEEGIAVYNSASKIFTDYYVGCFYGGTSSANAELDDEIILADLLSFEQAYSAGEQITMNIMKGTKKIYVLVPEGEKRPTILNVDSNAPMTAFIQEDDYDVALGGTRWPGSSTWPRKKYHVYSYTPENAFVNTKTEMRITLN